MPLNVERLLAQREQQKLNNRQIADKIGVNENTVGRWTSGERQPNSLNLSQLAEVLNVSVDFLLGKTDNPTPPPRNKVELNEKEFRILEAYRNGDWQRLMRLLGGDK